MSNEISGETTIAASPAQVWNILADFGGIAKWAALVKESTGNDTGVGAARTCSIIDGSELVETVSKWDEGRLIEYQIAGMPTSKAATTWTVAGAGNETKVGFSLQFECEPDLVAPMTEKISGFRDFLLGALKTNAETGQVMELPAH